MTESIANSGRIELLLILLPMLPMVGSLAILATSRSRMANAGRGIALGVLSATLLCAALMIVAVGNIAVVNSAVVSIDWISFPDGPDGLSLSADLPRCSIELLLLGSLILSTFLVVAAIEPGTKPSHVGLYCAGALLALFAASMVVFATDFLTLFVFWQFSGVLGAACMLRRDDDGRNAAVARKALLFGMVSDVALLVGILLIWRVFGTLDIRGVVDQVSGAAALSTSTATTLSTACLCLLAGTAGRCWQFPLIDLASDLQRLRGRFAGAVQQFLVMPIGVAVLLRCLPLFRATDGCATWIVAIGLLSSILAGLCALASRHGNHAAEWASVGLFGMMLVGLGTGSTAGVVGAVSLFVVHQILVPALCRMTGGSSHRLRLAGVILLVCGLGGQNRILAAVLPGQTGTIGFPGYLIAGLFGAVQFLFALALVRRLSNPDHETIHQKHERHDSPLGGFASILGISVAALFVVVAVSPLGAPRDLFAPAITAITGSRLLQIDWGTDWLVTLIALLPAAIGAITGWMTTNQETDAAEPSGVIARWFVNPARHGFYLDDIWDLFCVQPIRAVAQLVRFCEWFFIDRFLAGLPMRIPKLLIRCAVPLRTGSFAFYALSVLLATATLLAVMAWPGG